MDAARPFDFSAEPVTLLVVGTAPGVREDVATASTLRSSRIVMAVNFAAALLPADMLFSFHADMIERFAAEQRKFGPAFTTHSDSRKGTRRGFPAVDYFWPGLHLGATSGIGAAHVGLLMGFQEVILCGCPLNGFEGYTDGVPACSDRVWHNRANVETHQRAARAFAHKHGQRVFSMSGYTRGLFGPPPEAPCYGNH
jgi:hypothetical protein